MTEKATQSNTLDEYGYPLRPKSQRTLRNLVVHTVRRILLMAIYIVMSSTGTILRANRANKWYPPLTPQTFQPKHILVLRVDLIGDLVMSLTLVRVLKRTYPGAEIDLIAVPSSAKVVASDPNLTEIIPYDPNVWRRPKALFQLRNWREAWALRRHLHARNYDLAVSVFGQWAAILAVLSGAERRVGFGREGYPGFMTDNVAGKHWDKHDHKHEVDYCLELAQAVGATIESADRVPQLAVDPLASQQVAQLLQQEGISLPHRTPLIVCHVSSNNGQAKRWPVPYWASLIDRLLRENKAAVVLTGTPDDLALIEAVMQRTKEHPFNLAGKTSLTQLAALLQHADVMITGDSGPMHIGEAVGTPLIVIHGPTDPALSGPVSSGATVLRSTIWCSPCYNAKGPADCRFRSTQCMKNVTPTQVFTVVQEKLKYQHRVATGQKVGE